MNEKLGRKDDSAKRRYDLVPWKEFQEVVDVLTSGAIKYAPDNWKHVPEARSRYLAAAQRHIIDGWLCGERYDDISKGGDGKHHLAHAICCLLFIMWFDNNEDDASDKSNACTELEFSDFLMSLEKLTLPELQKHTQNTGDIDSEVYYCGKKLTKDQRQQLRAYTEARLTQATDEQRAVKKPKRGRNDI